MTLKTLVWFGMFVGFMGTANGFAESPGKAVLQSLQETAQYVIKTAGPSIVLVEVNVKYPGRGDGQEVEVLSKINGCVVDERGAVMIRYFKPDQISRITVWWNEQEYPARYIKGDQRSGVALIRFDAPQKLTPIVFGDARSLVPGQWLAGLAAGGVDLDFETVVTQTWVRAVVGTQTQDEIVAAGIEEDPLISMASQLPPKVGKSASVPRQAMPFVNAEGHVVGLLMNDRLMVIDEMKRAVAKMLKAEGTDAPKEEDADPWIGMGFEALKEDYATALHLPREGVLVNRVPEDGPAAKGGLRAGDLIIDVDGRPITKRGERALSQFRKLLDPEVGRAVQLKVMREHQTIALICTFEKKPKPTPHTVEEFGLTLQPVSSMDAYTYGFSVKEGMLVTKLEPGSPAATSTYFRRPIIQPGDVLQTVNGMPVRTPDDLHKMLEEVRRTRPASVLIQLVRQRLPSTVCLNLSIGQKTKSEEGGRP